VSRKWTTKRPKAKLTHKQQLYVAAYLECLEGKLAAEMAGYSKTSANDISKSLQRHPVIRGAIDKALDERERELKDKAVRTMEHAYAQATADIAELFDEEGAPLPLSKMPREVRRAIHSIEVEFENVIVKQMQDGKEVETVKRIPRLAKVKLHDKRASQELFVKYSGKLKDRVEFEAPALEQLIMQADTLFREKAEADEP
jgi:phage terminase small subunit